MGHPVDRKLG